MTAPEKPPTFGPLAGVRVVSAGSVLAGPFAAQLMAEWGADVAWVENPGTPDMVRVGAGAYWQEIERRNQRNIALDLQSDAGRTAFLALVATAEILVESSRGGQFARLGLSDDVLWKANPRLVIAHVSGFGQSGVPEVVERTCYDPIAQAFGCYMQLNGSETAPPFPAAAVPGDYFAGLMAASSALAALVKARATGEGESIDVAMFEVLLRVSTVTSMDYFNRGVRPVAGGGYPIGVAPYRCRDGVYVYLVMTGAGVLRRGLQLLGISDATLFPAGGYLVAPGSAAAERLQRALTEFCAARDAGEVEAQFAAASVPCSRILTYELAETHPHYLAREVVTEWQTLEGQPVRGIKIVPDFARHPGRIWRGAPPLGHDNEALLREAGLGDDEIEALRSSRALGGAVPRT